MRIRHLTLPSADPAACLAFYRDVMQLPTHGHTFTAGWTTVDVVQARIDTGSLHLAFNVPPHRFDAASQWISERALILATPGHERRFRLEGVWQSESIYFAGPHDAVLELIARDPLAVAHAETGRAAAFHGTEIACVSEVGLPTDNVAALTGQLADGFRLPAFGEASDIFAPMGTHEGLLILVDARRPWFPEGRRAPGAMGLHIALEGTERRGAFADAAGWVLSA